MGTGGTLKANSSSKGKSYGILLLIAFAAALFGVMLLHKLRERRIFNLLVKEKDQQIFTLHLLLQKERDYTKELKKKTEEKKAKAYSLRTQKMQLDNRILEMQATIASLQDEQRTMALALEEKQNEIKMLTDREKESSQENDSQVAALTRILKQKETEIDDLKHRVENPVKVWSVSTDDPSNSYVNVTASRSLTRDGETEGRGRKEEIGQKVNAAAEYNARNLTRSEGIRENESKDKVDENSERKEDGNEKGKEDMDRRGMSEEKLQEPKHSRDNEEGGDVEKGIDEKGNANATEVRERQQENTKFSRENEGSHQELGTNSKGGMKVKMASENTTVKGKHGYPSNARGKRWRMIAKTRRLEHNGDFAKRGDENIESSRRYTKNEQGSESEVTEVHLEKTNGHQNHDINSNSRDKPTQEDDKIGISENFKHGESLRRNDQDMLEAGTEEAASKEGKAGTERGENGGKLRNITGDAEKLEDEIIQKPEQEEIGSGQQNKNRSSDTNEVEDNAVQSKVVNDEDEDEDEERDDLEVADNPDSKTNAANGDNFLGTGSEMEDDKEEYKEETDESEF